MVLLLLKTERGGDKDQNLSISRLADAGIRTEVGDDNVALAHATVKEGAGQID